ncbi:MAG TPA: hypothetical protein VF720_01040 [Candidatus Eisenbacteria bacterium]
MRASILVTVIAGSLLAAAMSVLVNPRSASLVSWLTHRPATTTEMLALPDLAMEGSDAAVSPAENETTNGIEPPNVLTLPAGTVIRALLQYPIGSVVSRAGDAVTLSVIEPVLVGGAVAIPRGASVQGVVNEARGAEGGGGVGLLSLTYKSVTDVGGKMHGIKARHLRTTDLLPAGAARHGDVELQRGDILEVRLEAPLVVAVGAGRTSS